MVTLFVCCACHLGVIVVVCFVALLDCMCVFAYCVFVGTLISVVARGLLSCVAMPLPPDVDEWCVRIRALRAADAELGVGSGSRVESAGACVGSQRVQQRG